MTARTGAVVEVHDAFCLHPVPDGAVVALRGLSLTVADGERVVVHGPNGSGKTTLLRLLAGEQALSAGRAVVAGIDVGTGAGARPLWRAAQVGWVDQNPMRTLRPELDVLGNVLLQQRLAGLSREAALAAAEPLLSRLGVAHLAGRRPETLSGGEAQRVSVCAALAHGPRLVLADEPSGELDAASALEVYDALADAVAHAGAALVLVSHDRRAARVADRVVRIRDGRLSETWTPGPGGGPVEERLVVDDRGWVRLPGAARWSEATPESASDGSITLRPRGFQRPIARPDAPAASAGVVGAVQATVTAVTKCYAGRRVLTGIDLALRAGELTVLRGPSGAGKSTLLRVLLGLERPDSGTVTLDHADLAGLDRAALAALRRRVVAYAGQDVQLAETVDGATNLDLARTVRGLAQDPALVAEVLERLDLGALARRQVRLLSGGERQRVAVARALAVTPRLLVCDEPTSQLDEASAQR
ncbi:MAG: ATP-binding cassette domain-containing protein, partial [Kineosporiaceae bacterium]